MDENILTFKGCKRYVKVKSPLHLAVDLRDDLCWSSRCAPWRFTFPTVADILNQTHWWWTSMACLEGFTMRRFYHDALVATSVGMTWTMP